MVRKRDKESIRFFIAESPLFVYEDDCLEDALKKMKKYDVSSLTVVKKDWTIQGVIYRKDIFKQINSAENAAKKQINKCFRVDGGLLLLYPMSTTFEAVIAMKTLKRKAIPVANNPWEKKLVGVLWSNDIQNFSEAIYL